MIALPRSQLSLPGHEIDWSNLRDFRIILVNLRTSNEFLNCSMYNICDSLAIIPDIIRI